MFWGRCYSLNTGKAPGILVRGAFFFSPNSVVRFPEENLLVGYGENEGKTPPVKQCSLEFENLTSEASVPHIPLRALICSNLVT